MSPTLTAPAAPSRTIQPGSALLAQVGEIRRQLSAVLTAIGTDRWTLTAGQTAIVAAALEEAAECLNRQAEDCLVCQDWPDLCYACQQLSAEDLGLQELAAQLRGMGRS
jgi:hypothetical protein